MEVRTKPLPTQWNDTNFRSRTEARWAVFFEELNILYEYEPENLQLSNGVYYLPDFYLPQFNAYLEVKPNSDAIVTQECYKAQQLAIDMKNNAADTQIWLATGAPDINKARIIPLSNRLDHFGDVGNIIAETEIENSLLDEYGRYFLLEDRRDEGIYWLVAGNAKSDSIPLAYAVGGWGVTTDHERYPIMTTSIESAYKKASSNWNSIIEQ